MSQIKAEQPLWNHMQTLYPSELEVKKKMINERVMVKFLIGNTTKVLDTTEDCKYEW